MRKSKFFSSEQNGIRNADQKTVMMQKESQNLSADMIIESDDSQSERGQQVSNESQQRELRKMKARLLHMGEYELQQNEHCLRLLLQQGPAQRNAEDLRLICEFVNKLIFFEDLLQAEWARKNNVMRKYCKYLRYRKCETGELLFRVAQRAPDFAIVLNGQVNVYRPINQQMLKEIIRNTAIEMVQKREHQDNLNTVFQSGSLLTAIAPSTQRQNNSVASELTRRRFSILSATSRGEGTQDDQTDPSDDTQSQQLEIKSIYANNDLTELNLGGISKETFVHKNLLFMFENGHFNYRITRTYARGELVCDNVYSEFDYARSTQATAICKSDCEILYIEHTDFVALQQELANIELADIIEFFTQTTFRDCDPRCVQRVVQRAERVRIPQGDFLFFEGDSCEGIFLLHRGQVGLLKPQQNIAEYPTDYDNSSENRRSVQSSEGPRRHFIQNLMHKNSLQSGLMNLQRNQNKKQKMQIAAALKRSAAHAEVQHATAQGTDEFVLYTQERGSVVGDIAYFDNEPQRYSAVVLSKNASLFYIKDSNLEYLLADTRIRTFLQQGARATQSNLVAELARHSRTDKLDFRHNGIKKLQELRKKPQNKGFLHLALEDLQQDTQAIDSGRKIHTEVSQSGRVREKFLASREIAMQNGQKIIRCKQIDSDCSERTYLDKFALSNTPADIVRKNTRLARRIRNSEAKQRLNTGSISSKEDTEIEMLSIGFQNADKERASSQRKFLRDNYTFKLSKEVSHNQKQQQQQQQQQSTPLNQCNLLYYVGHQRIASNLSASNIHMSSWREQYVNLTERKLNRTPLRLSQQSQNIQPPLALCVSAKSLKTSARIDRKSISRKQNSRFTPNFFLANAKNNRLKSSFLRTDVTLDTEIATSASLNQQSTTTTIQTTTNLGYDGTQSLQQPSLLTISLPPQQHSQNTNNFIQIVDSTSTQRTQTIKIPPFSAQWQRIQRSHKLKQFGSASQCDFGQKERKLNQHMGGGFTLVQTKSPQH